MKAMTFETLVEKIAKREKAFGKEESKSNEETLCLAQKGHKSKEEFAKDENRTEVEVEDKDDSIEEGEGIFNQGEKQCYRCGKTGHTSSYCRTF